MSKIPLKSDSKTLAEELKEAVVRLREQRLDRIFRENLTAGYAAAANLFSAVDPVGDFDSLTAAGYRLDLLTGTYYRKRTVICVFGGDYDRKSKVDRTFAERLQTGCKRYAMPRKWYQTSAKPPFSRQNSFKPASFAEFRRKSLSSRIIPALPA